jgi:hypothetical protein
MTNEEIIEALEEEWEESGAKTISIEEGELAFDASEFIESLSYSNARIPSRKSHA